MGMWMGTTSYPGTRDISWQRWCLIRSLKDEQWLFPGKWRGQQGKGGKSLDRKVQMLGSPWQALDRSRALIIIIIIRWTCYPSDLSLLMLTLVSWPRQCLSVFSSAELLFFPVSILSSLEAQSTLKKWTVTLHPLEGGVQKLLGICLHRRLVSSSPFIYSFNHLFL